MVTIRCVSPAYRKPRTRRQHHADLNGGVTYTASPLDVLRGAHRGPRGGADGPPPAGTTVFDDEIPAVAKLDPALLSAVRQAATDAADDGVELFVDSGWRSPAYQEQL